MVKAGIPLTVSIVNQINQYSLHLKQNRSVLESEGQGSKREENTTVVEPKRRTPGVAMIPRLVSTP